MSGPHGGLSHSAGRWFGRWLRRYRPVFRRTAEPARRGVGIAMSYLLLVGYIWIGTVMAVGLQRLVGTTSPYTLIAGAGGGALVGWWISRHRLAQIEDPDMPPQQGVGVALLAWIAVVGLSLLLGTPDV